MNKKLLGTLIVLAFLIAGYAVAWIQIDIQSNKYFKEGVANYNSGNYIVALKGSKVFNSESSIGYTFTGGFEQVVQGYSAKGVWPKPPVYYKAEKYVNDIIQNKITTTVGLQAYNTYFRVDNTYLPQILLDVAQQYQAQGDNALAYQTYSLIYNSFPYNKQATTAQNAMNQLSGSATLSTSGAANY